MGGAVSSGCDNNELIDNLMSGNYIRTRRVEKVFRALDRADYMTPEARDQAYKDLAWRNGPLHLSSPCIYSEVMEGLELKPGLTFLNIGSGTGYLSTLAGLILGSSGISHGVEVHPTIVEYATKKLSQFIENSPSLDDFDFCEPKFFTGNGLCIAPLQCGYDRVYCGAGCPEEYENYFKNLIKVGGILVLPINDQLQQVKRVADNKWVSRSLLNVSFASLRVPTQDDALDQVKLGDLIPPRLQLLARARVRASMREGVIRRNPELKERPWRRPPRMSCPRRICIPIEPGGEVQNLNVLHDLDAESGAHEMNALLSLVISMGQNRVAGALRFDRVARRSNDSADSDHSGRSRDGRDSDDDSDGDGDDDDDDADDAADAIPSSNNRADGDKADTPEQDKEKGTHKVDKTEQDNEKTDKTEEIDDKSTDKANTSKEADSRDESENKETESHSDQTLELTDKLKKKKFSGKRSKKMNKLSKKYFRKSSSDSIDDEQPSTSKGGDNDKDDSKQIRRPKTPVKEDSSGNDDDDDDDNKPDPSNPMPSEVEIFIPKMQEPGTSSEMDWEDSRPKVVEEEGGEGVTKSKAKRQKLDSGIGENTPSSSPTSKTEDSEGSETDDSESWETDPESGTSSGRRVRGRGRGRGGLSLEEVVERAEARRQRRRRASAARGGDARRVRLSLLMKRAIRELPLPQPLKKFVNWGRCYEF